MALFLITKVSNVAPVHKKGDKQLPQNYRPASVANLQQNFREIQFNPIFAFLDEHGLLCPYQSGFCPFDSCENQLLSIIHDSYANFDQHPTLLKKANLLDISKAFGRIWHEGLLFKLECIGITGNLLNPIKSFLSNRFQWVVLNGQCSSRSSVFAEVPKGSVLGPLLFLAYINDLPDNLQSTVKLSADETLFSAMYDILIFQLVN